MRETIEVFKAGRHQAMNGKVFEFTDADVADIVASYDPALSAAPIVLGHPKTNDPAWAWAEGLSLNDKGRVVAKLEKIQPAFAEGVDEGRYRYVSASLYHPDDTNNPKPGSWYLRHLGFLGAVPPAVKGLEAAFAEEPGELIEFSTADGFWVRDIFRSLRDFFIEKFGLDVADKVIPSWSVDNVEKVDPAAAVSDYAEPALIPPAVIGAAPAGDDAVFAERAAELATREAALAAREATIDGRAAEFAEAARQEARVADTTFVDGLVAAGRLPPVQRDRMVGIFARLAGDVTVSFSEPDADPRAELRELLGGLGVSIVFAEVAGGPIFDPTRADAAPAIAERIGQVRAEAAKRGEVISFSEAASRLA